MIKEWTIRNFKAISEVVLHPIKLEALNILVGSNSSGKSTLIQSILMVAQTLANSSGERPIILNGEMVRLGHASEVMHEGAQNHPLFLRFVLQPVEKKSFQPIKVEAEFGLTENGYLGFNLLRSEISQGEHTGILAQKLSLKERGLTNLDAHTDWYVDPQLKVQINKHWFDYKVIRYPTKNRTGLHGTDGESFNTHISFFHFLPQYALEVYDRELEVVAPTMRRLAEHIVDEQVKTLHESLFSSDLSERAGTTLRNNLSKALRYTIRTYYEYKQAGNPTISALRAAEGGLEKNPQINFGDWADQIRKYLPEPARRRLAQQMNLVAAEVETRQSQKAKSDEIGLRRQILPLDIGGPVDSVIQFFTKRLRYLGPLRDDPRAIYGMPFNPETTDVGSKGEYTAAVLERYKEEIIVTPLPPRNDIFERKTRKAPLIEAIAEWLKHMDLVEDVVTHDRGKIGYEIAVHALGVKKELDLTNVGVGVSQVLPTLVMALLAPEDSILLFEQPELHLHPKVQLRLGDFFLGIAQSGRQCIVETHSEYLINRIKRRNVEAEGTSLMDKTMIYFVERDQDGTQFRRVQPNEYGAILDWPKGFFDEGPAEAELLMRAAMRKRKNSQPQK